MNSYGGTIQIKALQQYLLTVLFVFQYLTKLDFGFFQTFEFVQSWQWVII